MTTQGKYPTALQNDINARIDLLENMFDLITYLETWKNSHEKEEERILEILYIRWWLREFTCFEMKKRGDNGEDYLAFLNEEGNDKYIILKKINMFEVKPSLHCYKNTEIYKLYIKMKQNGIENNKDLIFGNEKKRWLPENHTLFELCEKLISKSNEFHPKVEKNLNYGEPGTKNENIIGKKIYKKSIYQERNKIITLCLNILKQNKIEATKWIPYMIYSKETKNMITKIFKEKGNKIDDNARNSMIFGFIIFVILAVWISFICPHLL